MRLNFRSNDPAGDVIEAAVSWRLLVARAAKEETWRGRAKARRGARRQLKVLAQAADRLAGPA